MILSGNASAFYWVWDDSAGLFTIGGSGFSVSGVFDEESFCSGWEPPFCAVGWDDVEFCNEGVAVICVAEAPGVLTASD